MEHIENNVTEQSILSDDILCEFDRVDNKDIDTSFNKLQFKWAIDFYKRYVKGSITSFNDIFMWMYEHTNIFKVLRDVYGDKLTSEEVLSMSNKEIYEMVLDELKDRVVFNDTEELVPA
jgi:hypothetical protein